jgi:hypothetical protein
VEQAFAEEQQRRQVITQVLPRGSESYQVGDTILIAWKCNPRQCRQELRLHDAVGIRGKHFQINDSAFAATAPPSVIRRCPKNGLIEPCRRRWPSLVNTRCGHYRPSR